jgi:hypothetical protein
MFGGCHRLEREIISSAAKTALSISLLSEKIGSFVCECSQVELRELIYSRHRRAKERMAPVQSIWGLCAHNVNRPHRSKGSDQSTATAATKAASKASLRP